MPLAAATRGSGSGPDRSTDGGAVLAAHGDPRATEHLSFEPRTREQTGTGHIVARSIAAATAEPRTEYALAVVAPPSGRPIGLARPATDPHQQRAAAMGFVLRRVRGARSPRS